MSLTCFFYLNLVNILIEVSNVLLKDVVLLLANSASVPAQ